MSENKLTDNEIVKALEGMIQFANTVDRSVLDMVDVKTLKNILDLINRLQAENGVYETCNARKDEAIKHLESEVKRLRAENERLKEFATSKCEDCAGCTSWKCDCANIERVAYEKCIEKVKEEIKQALESNHKAKHEHIEKHYQCLSCDFLATVRGKIDALSGLDYFLDNLSKELVGDTQPNDVKCIDCEYLELELPFAVCGKAYKGIVAPNDSCGKGKIKELVGEDK